MAERAKSTGTSFQSRSDATSDFKQKYATTYTSKYTTEPTSRPEHIPTETVVNNHHYTVVYNSGYHGYGYYVGSSWYAYDALDDAYMLSRLMTRHSYYYPPYQPTYVPPSYSQPVYTSGSGWPVIGAIVLGLFVLAVVAVVANNRG